MARAFLIRRLTGAIDAPSLIFRSMERREKLGDYYEGDKRWDEMLLKVWYFSLIIYASIRTMPGCGKTWVCFAHFFFKEGAGGLLRRQGGKRWEERLLEEEASLCSDVAASSYWTPHPPPKPPTPPPSLSSGRVKTLPAEFSGHIIFWIIHIKMSEHLSFTNTMWYSLHVQTIEQANDRT